MKLTVFILGFLALTSAAAFAGYSVDVRFDKSDGFYKVGEETICTATLTKDGQPAVGEKLRCTVKRERDILRQDEFFCDGNAVKIKASIDRPGWLYFWFEIIGPDGNPLQGEGISRQRTKPTVVGEIGAMYDAHEIRALDSRPADFDAYWASCRFKLDQVPLDPKMTEVEVPLAVRGKVKCYSVEVKCLGRTPITGYLAVPIDARPKSLPAYVSYQSRVWQDASKKRALEMASNGGLALYVSWHGLPTGTSEEEYKKMSRTWSEEDGKAGDTDRDTWSGHDMYLRAMRALDFIKSRPQWNHKELVVAGGSLGGIQTIAAAALDRDITIAVVSVPTGCEYNGHKQGRDAAGLYRGKLGIARIEADPRRAVTLAYHDGVNLAPLIQCDIYVCTGFVDDRCTPSSVFAFYNALPATTKKFMSTNPSTGHYGTTKNTAGDERLSDIFRSVTVD
jgi:cephalosporin-C deacetylase